MDRTNPMTPGREVALQYLYMLDNTNEAEDFDEFLKFMGDLQELPSERAIELARVLCCMVQKNKARYDASIELHADNWKLKRMPVVDRNILRLALAELETNRVTHEIVLDEAINLAKKFGDIEKSPKFVNGVLDKARLELQNGTEVYPRIP